MINFIYGLPGTGKTTLIKNKIKNDIKSGKQALLIVTEQQTVEVERSMLKLLPPSAQLNFEVLNFSRLANKLFRIYGGLSYNYITDGMKNLFMKRTLLELAPMLGEYQLRALGDSALPSLMLSQINEFKVNSVSAARLEIAAGKLDEGHPLKSKLADLAIIYQAFEGMVNNAYDDGAHDLEKLYEILCKHNFFNGYNVYVDGFSSFTACEHKILGRIFAQADNCFVTIPASGESLGELHLLSVNETSRKLRAMVGDNLQVSVLDTPHRATSAEAKRILNSLWDFSLDTKKLEPIEEDGFVSITECSDPYRESEAVANTVLSLLRNGYRRREIAVIAGNMDSYRGIIDSVFEKAGIPYFMSESTDLVSEPLISLILSAFAIRLKNWRTEDVIAYLKTGLTDIAQNDADIFEIYLSTWKIRGNKFMEDSWSMNPDGYYAEISARGLKILETANRVKNELTSPLIRFFTQLDASKSVAELCDATYAFFKSMKLSEKLAARAKKAYAMGNRKAALECAGTHKAFVKALSDISASMGELEMTVEEFASSLKLVLNNTDIGTIPTAADEVILGSASMLRASDIKCAILIGMCDGEFPAQVSENGFFSDNEKNILKGLDIELTGDTASRNSEELLYAYRAMTLPSEKLFLFYHTSSSGNLCKPSLAISRALALLPHVKVISYEAQEETDKLASKKLSFELLGGLSPDTRRALYEIFKDDGEYAEILRQLETPISDTECHVTKESAEEIFGNKIYLTQSRLEKYIKCHFAYYCQYVLKLRETETASFNFSDTGTFIHRILECFMRSAVDENGFKKELSRDEIKNTVIEEAEKYINELFKDKFPPSKRLLHHFNRLKKLALLIATDLYNEMRESSFTPKFFELAIGKGSSPMLPAHEILLKDGSKILLSGVVDRVDVFKRGNEVYIKIVDYKTGSKKFSVSDIEKGLNTQMLLYLFAICNTSSARFKKEIGCADGDTIKPASIMYISTLVSPVDASGGASQDEIFSLASEKITREGLVLNDEEIIKALNQNKTPKYLADIKADKTGANKGKALASPEDFAALEALINQTISDIAEEMKNGNASAEPLKVGNTLPCEYCKMKQFCRIDAVKKPSDENTEDEYETKEEG